MEILGYKFFEKQQPAPVQLIEKVDSNITVINSFAFGSDNSYLPSQTNFYNSASYVRFGDDNIFTNRLSDLYLSSPLHKNAIDLKSKLIAGSGVEFQNENIQLKAFFDAQPSGLEELIKSLAIDLKIYGNYYLKVTFNVNHTKIIKIERLPAFGVRLGALDLNYKPTKVFYSYDWLLARQYSTYPIYNVENKTDLEQIIVGISNPIDSRIYQFPDYTSGLNSISAGAAISVFQLTVVENSFSPGMAIKIYKKPNSEEEKRKVVEGIKKQYQGKKNAGKVLVLFSSDKESSPDIIPVEVSNLDKQFTVLEQSIENNIIYSHQIVSGLLLGVQTAGKLGSTNEIQNGYMILEKTSIASDRKAIENTINKVLRFNQYPEIKIKPFIVFEEQITTQNKSIL